ncbi:MAG: class I mannose-6-phosphate isomerase [Polymorphobacter sp.]
MDAVTRSVAIGARRLHPEPHAKPWGRTDLGAWGGELAAGAAAAPLGEIHHLLPGNVAPELLVKTLFTSAPLSVQVHPDARTARAHGLPTGKDEAWVILAAEPAAVIGLGLAAPMEVAAARAAALDGSIADRLVWHRCTPGDVFFAPAGSIHAIGAGVMLFEFQQNIDVTYRLFDYGRGRALHLDAALAAARLEPWQPQALAAALAPGRTLLVEGPGFVLERLQLNGSGRLALPPGQPLWIAVVSGGGTVDAAPFCPGEVWYADRAVTVDGSAELLIAYLGASTDPDLWQPAS